MNWSYSSRLNILIIHKHIEEKLFYGDELKHRKKIQVPHLTPIILQLYNYNYNYN